MSTVDLADESAWLYCCDPRCPAVHVDLREVEPVTFEESSGPAS